MKKFLNVFLSFMILVSALGVTAFAESEKLTLELTLSEAIEMALKDNPQLLAVEATKHSNKINLDAAKLNKVTYKNMIVSTSAYDLVYIKKGYYVDMFSMLMKLNDKEMEKIKSKISYDVTQSYYNYKLSLSLCELTEDAYELAKKNLDNVQKRFELGMIAKIDMENAKLSVESVKNTLETYKRNSEIAKENLKIMLQLDDKDCDFILTDSIAVSEFEANIDEDIKNAMETRYDVTALKENYNMAKLYLKYTEPLTANSAKYQTAYSDYITKEYNYTNNKKLIALSLKNTYYSVLNAKDELATAEKKADIAKQKYDIAVLKFDSGMITNTDVTQALNEYLSENISLENSKLNYKMAAEKYYAEISTGM